MHSGKPFSGPHSTPNEASPIAPSPLRGRAARRVSVRSAALFFLPAPLLFAAFAELTAGNASAMLIDAAAYVAFMLGAWLLREGERAEQTYERHAVASPPAIPRKLLAAAAAGAGTYLATASGWGLDMLTSGLFAAAAGGAHLIAFGLDPMKSKGIEGASPGEAERLSAAIGKAETAIAAIETAAEAIRDRKTAGQINRMAAAARQIVRQIEADPRDLRRARRFLTVYLSGAQAATEKYAHADASLRDAAMDAKFRSLLDDLEATFARQREALLLDDRTNLDVEIEVLSERLAREGIR